MLNVYFIGGSPCSGKSTVAETIAKHYNFHYFKVDDFLDKYTARGAKQNKPNCIKQTQMTPEQIWMRNPEEQNAEELQFYEEVFEFLFQDIQAISSENKIITEGAALLPRLMKQTGIKQKHYVSITPTKKFQITHYKERPWVYNALEGCSDKEQAFKNWMDRDILFANEIRQQCVETGYTSFVNDGTILIDDLVKRVCLSFGL
ncbi:hypothetical protein GZH47_00735 [Paenibacillus rhizovicinus]|uniref:Uncharacterized protein n=1 Tax=Paenibacillus rhizovicinus TaxID=2704463 RepID=A0A6C0NUT3_9BACL|nr:hypothetical protein [Paenibacillus rhizovicinus]QHW29503.1 hypothetical protein GZH47_00735 [Paenibacillus rhizovicinus]